MNLISPPVIRARLSWVSGLGDPVQPHRHAILGTVSCSDRWTDLRAHLNLSASSTTIHCPIFFLLSHSLVSLPLSISTPFPIFLDLALTIMLLSLCVSCSVFPLTHLSSTLFFFWLFSLSLTIFLSSTHLALYPISLFIASSSSPYVPSHSQRPLAPSSGLSHIWGTPLMLVQLVVGLSISQSSGTSTGENHLLNYTNGSINLRG